MYPCRWQRKHDLNCGTVPQSNEALPSDEIPLNRGTTGLSKFSVRNFECFIHISPQTTSEI